MKFNIEIELENGDYCNGCPIAIIEQKPYSTGFDCACGKYRERLDYEYDLKTLKVKRPEICKEQNKEKTK